MAAVRHWPGMRSEYAWLPARDGPTVTGEHQIGVSFSGHRDLVYATGGRSRTRDIEPGSTIVSAADVIEWRRVREPTEALEIYPDPDLLAGAGPVEFAQRIGCRDGTVLGVATVLRRAHVAGAALTDVAASTLAHRLVAHLLERYAGVRAPGGGRLAPATVDRVTDLVEARLHTTLTLDDLAAVARLSPYHFSRAFRAGTGLAPYEFVTARRMDRARLLLGTTRRTVEEVAAGVGFTNLSHFRRTFRRHHGVPPSAARPQEPTFRAGAVPGQPGGHADQ
jgi:AraC family transcriptional regulator